MYRSDMEAFLNNQVAFNPDSLPTKPLDATFDFHSNIQNRNNVERWSPTEYTYFPYTFLVIFHTSLAFIFISRIITDSYQSKLHLDTV